MVIVLICFSCNCFYLNQLACHHYKTIHKMKSLCHLVYRYIFCLPSRRLMQITVRALEIVYSFGSLLYLLLLNSLTRNDNISFSFSIWQHSPLSSFSFECVPQHFFRSIDTFHIPHVHNSYNYKLHTYHHVLLKNSDNYSYNFYTLSFVFK